ncbi:MAG: hypothetical protein ACFBSD_09450 [Paracoccaceae bacterium]
MTSIRRPIIATGLALVLAALGTAATAEAPVSLWGTLAPVADAEPATAASSETDAALPAPILKPASARAPILEPHAMPIEAAPAAELRSLPADRITRLRARIDDFAVLPTLESRMAATAPLVDDSDRFPPRGTRLGFATGAPVYAPARLPPTCLCGPVFAW